MENFGFGEPSIYQILYEHLDERGYLPRDFSLRAVLAEKDDTGDAGILFSDGFMEGNLTGSDKGEEQSTALQTITQQVMEGRYQKAADGLKAFFAPEESHLMNQYVLPLQEWIYEKRHDFDPERLVWFAVHLLQEADTVEIVKYALTLLEFYDFHKDEEIAPMLRLLAQCNEFTLFCLRDFSVWDTALEEIFGVAQLVYGWGRIFSLEVLEPKTAEIRHWMLLHGWDNDVNPEYTALLIAEAVDLAGVLRQPQLNGTAFHSAAHIVDALLPDEPVQGISGLADAPGLLNEFLRHAKEHAHTLEDYEIVWHILQYAHTKLQGNAQTSVEQACGAVLQTFACAKTVQEAMEKGKGFALARALELPYTAKAVQLVIQNPLQHVDLLPYVLNGDAHHDHHVMELYEELLPGMALEESKPLTLREQLEGSYMDLNRILSQLYGFPGTGETLLQAALRSPALMNRHAALEIVNQWQDLGYQLSALLREAVEKLLLQETSEDNRVKAKAILYRKK